MAAGNPIREFFDTAVIIDDHLFTFSRDAATPGNDVAAGDQGVPEKVDAESVLNIQVLADLERSKEEAEEEAPLPPHLNDLSLAGLLKSRTLEANRSDRSPDELLRWFQQNGILTSPIPFVSDGNGRQMALKQALAAKLIVLDWELSGKDYAEAVSLVWQFLAARGRGMKWVIIYTQEKTEPLPDLLLARLRLEPSDATDVDADVILRVQESIKSASDKWVLEKQIPRPSGVPLLIFEDMHVAFVKKDPAQVDQVLEIFTKVLRRQMGPISSAILGMASEMERATLRLLPELLHPFETSVHLHAEANQISYDRLGHFLYRLYTEKVLEVMAEDVVSSFLTQARHDGLQYLAVQFTRSEAEFNAMLKSWLSMISDDGPRKGENWAWPAFFAAVKVSPDLDALRTACLNDLKQWGVDPQDNRLFLTALELLYAFAHAPRENAASLQKFFASLQEQAYAFMMFLKYEAGAADAIRIRTGDIFESLKDDGGNAHFLLCITPFCDVSHPENVKHKFKFVTGVEVDPFQVNEEAWKAYNSHYSLVPSTDGLPRLVRWTFYDVRTETLKGGLRKSMEPSCVFVGRLKKEYAQQILNRYVAYQSRAGVPEIYFKEWWDEQSYLFLHADAPDWFAVSAKTKWGQKRIKGLPGSTLAAIHEGPAFPANEGVLEVLERVAQTLESKNQQGQLEAAAPIRAIMAALGRGESPAQLEPIVRSVINGNPLDQALALERKVQEIYYQYLAEYPEVVRDWPENRERAEAYLESHVTELCGRLGERQPKKVMGRLRQFLEKMTQPQNAVPEGGANGDPTP